MKTYRYISNSGKLSKPYSWTNLLRIIKYYRSSPGFAHQVVAVIRWT